MGRIFSKIWKIGSWQNPPHKSGKLSKLMGRIFSNIRKNRIQNPWPKAFHKPSSKILTNSFQIPAKILPNRSTSFQSSQSLSKSFQNANSSKIWPESFPYPSNVQTPSKPFHNPQSRFLSNSFPTPKSFQNLAKFLPKSFQNPSSQSFAHLKLIKNNILPDSFPPKSCQHPLKITKIPKPPNPNSQPSALRFQSAISNPRPWYLKTTNDDAPRVCQI